MKALDRSRRTRGGNPAMLRAVTIAYVAWSLLPVLVAIQFSFNAGRSRSVWQGFSTRWYLTDAASVARDDSLRLALTQSLRLAGLTMLVATPLGVALALGLARWRGRGGQGSQRPDARSLGDPRDRHGSSAVPGVRQPL